MELSKYIQHYSNKHTAISIRCAPRDKLRFDEIVAATNKSKTQYILEMIDEKYRELFLD